VEWIYESPPFSFFKPRKKKPPKRPLNRWGIHVTFLHPHESQLSAICCVTLNQIDLSYMICIRSFMVLCPHYSTLSSPLPIRCDKISQKGEFSNRLCWFVFMRNCLRYSKILEFEGNLRRSKFWEVEGKILWNEFCPFHEITGFTLTLNYKVLRIENSEENSEESRLFTKANLVLRPA